MAAAALHSTAPAVEAVTIRLDGEVRGKGRPRFTRTGHAYTPEETRAYEDKLRTAARNTMHAAGLGPADVPLHVRVVAEIAVPDSWPAWKKERALTSRMRPTTKPDADNILKMLDALNGVVWVDDTYAVEVSVAKVYSATPGLTVTVSPLPALPAQATRKEAA